MLLRKLTLPTLAVLAAGAALAGLRAPRPAAAAEAPAPGQLAILGPRGERAGLCPLKHTAVEADVAGFVARVTVKQEFTNPSREPVEAIYTFPLPEDAAVDDMLMAIGQRVVRGQIKRREEARRIYEAARAEGRAAALLDQERPNIFTQSVANIMPGDRVVITIRYVHLLRYDEGQYEFVFPMVVGPRYTPGGGYTVPGRRGEPSPPLPAGGLEREQGARSVVTDADRITPPITLPGTRAGHDISLSVSLDAGLPLEEVRSPLHEVTVQREGDRKALIRLREEQTIPNKDFILRYRVAGDRIRAGVLTHAPTAGKGGYFTLILQPPRAPEQKDVAPKEMVFVIDQTGSQSGQPIEKAKETMRFCLENLNPGDSFQLLAFNTQVFPCFSQPVPVTPESVQQALQFLNPLQGNGGTDILTAVDFALKIPADPARPRIICYMTDGYVGNDMQILEHIRKNRGQARMFPFGVGNSVNRFLIEGMAREGRGAPYVVTLDTPGERAAAKFYQRVAKPLLLDVRVEWNGLPVEETFPEAIPDVFSACPIILKGRYTRPAEGEITVRGLLRGQPWSQRVPVSLPAVDRDGAAIATLWAREKIEHLQSQDWGNQQLGRPDPRIVEQIVGLALDYRLMTQHTSFVAVEERVVNVGGKQRRVDVPVEMPEGVRYEGILDFGEELLGKPARFLRSRVGGGGALGAPAGSGGPAAPPLASPYVAAERSREQGVPTDKAERDIRDGKPEGEKRLAEMKPEERRKLLAEIKLSDDLRKKLGGKQRLEVQVWLNSLPADGLQRLKALGFNLAAQLKPGRLLLGTLPAARLEAVIALPWVRLVESPRYLP